MADLNSDERMRLATEGKAMPDGSYPVRDCEDLKSAIQAYGNETGDRVELRHFLIKRSIALGCTEEIPDEWQVEIHDG